MPRFVVVEALDREAVSLASPIWEYLPNATSLEEASTYYVFRAKGIATQTIEYIRNASRRQRTQQTPSSELPVDDTGDSTVTANADSVEDTPPTPDAVYPYMGEFSPLFEAIDTPEEVIDLAETAAVRVMHATIAESDPTTDEWHPPQNVKKAFGTNAWSALGCLWVIVFSFFMVGILYARSRKALRRSMAAHQKFL